MLSLSQLVLKQGSLRSHLVRAAPRRHALSALAIGLFASVSTSASADEAAHQAEVRVILATKCDTKKVDPSIGEPAPPKMGFECLKLLDKKTMTFANGKASMTLPDGRIFQLVHTGRAGTRHKLTGSIGPSDGGPGYPVGNITAEPNVPINIGIKQKEDSAVFLTIRITS